VKKALLVACLFLAFSNVALAADAALVDSLVSVSLGNGAEQVGVLTLLKGDKPQALVLLMPGDPGVLRPEVADGKVSSIRLRGNPLVRARHLLVRPGLATLLVDCRSDTGDSCREAYVLSKARFEDVARLLARVKRDVPTVKKVWVVGHSYGSHSSSSLARYGEGVIDGAIHTSAILSPKNAYTMLGGWDYSAAKVPQLIIAHRNDPCPGTAFAGAERTAKRYNIPLVAVTEASGMRGDPCGPFSQHGFVGAEKIFMNIIADAVENGVDKFKH
jgi:alpha/beta superfamily hydrolase